ALLHIGPHRRESAAFAEPVWADRCDCSDHREYPAGVHRSGGLEKAGQRGDCGRILNNGFAASAAGLPAERSSSPASVTLTSFWIGAVGDGYKYLSFILFTICFERRKTVHAFIRSGCLKKRRPAWLGRATLAGALMQ